MRSTGVNRSLKDRAMDRIDHALGRPVDPLSETYRDYFCTDIRNPEADEMAASACWHMGRTMPGGMVYFYVTKFGRETLARHLRQIGDQNRLYVVSWDGHDMMQVAASRAKAKYARWLEISDVLHDLTFAEFQRTASVRLA